MRCADLADLICAYADGQTRPEEAAPLLAHLGECPDCQAALRRQRQTARLLRLADGAERWEVPDLRLRVARAAAAARARRHRRMAQGLVAGLLAILAACQVLAGPTAPVATAPIAQGMPHALICRVCLQPEAGGTAARFAPLTPGIVAPSPALDDRAAGDADAVPGATAGGRGGHQVLTL